jgi:hypothetical protein
MEMTTAKKAAKAKDEPKGKTPTRAVSPSVKLVPQKF